MLPSASCQKYEGDFFGWSWASVMDLGKTAAINRKVPRNPAKQSTWLTTEWEFLQSRTCKGAWWWQEECRKPNSATQTTSGSMRIKFSQLLTSNMKVRFQLPWNMLRLHSEWYFLRNWANHHTLDWATCRVSHSSVEIDHQLDTRTLPLLHKNISS